MMNWFAKSKKTVTDEMLETSEQSEMRSLVKGLAHEELSLAWRSQLNLKLLEASDKRQSKRRVLRIATWGSSLGIGLATSVFVGLLLTHPASSIPTARAQASLNTTDLAKVHQETISFASVSGTGAVDIETAFTPDGVHPDSFELKDELL
jgi:hypothetical protein